MVVCDRRRRGVLAALVAAALLVALGGAPTNHAIQVLVPVSCKSRSESDGESHGVSESRVIARDVSGSRVIARDESGSRVIARNVSGSRVIARDDCPWHADAALFLARRAFATATKTQTPQALSAAAAGGSGSCLRLYTQDYPSCAVARFATRLADLFRYAGLAGAFIFYLFYSWIVYLPLLVAERSFEYVMWALQLIKIVPSSGRFGGRQIAEVVWLTPYYGLQEAFERISGPESENPLNRMWKAFFLSPISVVEGLYYDHTQRPVNIYGLLSRGRRTFRDVFPEETD